MLGSYRLTKAFEHLANGSDIAVAVHVAAIHPVKQACHSLYEVLRTRLHRSSLFNLPLDGGIRHDQVMHRSAMPFRTTWLHGDGGLGCLMRPSNNLA